MSNTVYVHIRHWLFWYGKYSFCEHSCNDEITIYKDKNKKELLGYFEITTYRSLEYFVNNEDGLELDDPELYFEIKKFLESDDKIYYSYIYPRCQEDIIDQVKHNAPINDKGYKPIYIDMWSKISDYWTEDEIKKCVKTLTKDFFSMNVDRVEILDIPTYKETKLSYNKDYI